MKPPEIVVLLLAELDGDPTQVRSNAAADDGMVRSMDSGQLQPILVYRKGNRYVVLDGHRRVAALASAGRDRVNAVIVDAPEKPGERVRLQLICNLQREDLSPMDRARAFRAYMDETGCTANELADGVGLSPASVSRALALLVLPEERQQQIAAGEMTASDGYRLARRGESTPATARRSDDSATADDATGTPKTRAARAVAQLLGGRQVAFSAPNPLTLELVIEMTEDLLAKARKYRNRGATLETLVAQLKLDAKAGRSAGEA